ncbi:MAG: peptidoglycan-associated lipoprotein Pal [Paracoccaceae bacterium]
MKIISAIALVAAIAVAGCSSDEAAKPTANTGVNSGANTSGTGGPSPNSVAYFNQVVGDRVFFGTDQHRLDGDAQSTLQRQAQWLSANPGTNVTIEGHADERGTRQYNLALGARRANSVRSYLISQGVPAARLRAVTFGKERPVALGSDANSWSQNRRGVSVVAGAPTS